MSSEGHLLFSIACAVLAKKTELTPTLAHSDWWHIVPSAMLTCLLPDIDHPQSFIGQRLKWISRPIARMCGHRGFTHSLLAIFVGLSLFHLNVPHYGIVAEDALQGMVIGYLSHIVADMLTPAGIPLLWPCRWRFRIPIIASQQGSQIERVLSIALLVCALWMPHRLDEKTAAQWSSMVLNQLQTTFSHYVKL